MPVREQRLTRSSLRAALRAQDIESIDMEIKPKHASCSARGRSSSYSRSQTPDLTFLLTGVRGDNL